MFSRSVGFTPTTYAPASFASRVENVGSVDANGDFDIVYYNADIINSKSTNSLTDNDDPFVKFQETRNIPILKNASAYEFSILRFQINGPNKNLPLMVPQIALGLTANPTQNINLTTYTLGLSIEKTFNVTVGGIISLVTYKGYASAPIIYIPENETYGSLQNGSLPNPPLTQQDISSYYYYVYTYDHWAGLVNNTFETIMRKLQTDFNTWYATTYPALPNPPFPAVAPTIDSKAPYMTYDPATKLFSIYYDVTSFGDLDALNYVSAVTPVPIPPTPAPNQPTVGQELMFLYSNNNFYGLFSSFDTDFVDLTSTLYNPPFNVGVNTNEVILFNVYNKLNTNIWIPNSFVDFPALAPKGYYKMAENYPNTSSLWNPISAIVFTSSQLPINNESISAPVILGQSNDISNNTSSNFAPIIGDIAVNLKNAEDYCNLIFYEPNGELKMASMMGGSNNAINNIDIQVYFRNRLDNKLYPIRMFNYSSVSMKMMFRKKHK